MKKENVSSTNQRQNKPSNSSSLPDRKSYRAKWHNYSGSEYFVTFCTYERRHYLGEVRNGQTELTKVGKYLKTEIEKVQDFYPYAEIPIYVIMPDHVHLIMEIRKDTWNRKNADAINHNADAINRVPTGDQTRFSEYCDSHLAGFSSIYLAILFISSLLRIMRSW